MRWTLMAGLVAGALLATSVPAAIAGDGPAGLTGKQLIDRCIRQANNELRGTGRSIKRSQFDTIVVGGPGNDDFSGYPPIDPGRDLFCGFGGNDFRGNDPGSRVGPGDVFVGGGGADFVFTLDGGTFVGGNGNDGVQELLSGLFVGGGGIDNAFEMSHGRFYGRDGVDTVKSQLGGRFFGARGNDSILLLAGGRFNGNAGADSVSIVDKPATFAGGTGDDSVGDLWGSFSGGDGKDEVSQVQRGGRFVGGLGRDTADLVLGKFYGNKGWDVTDDLDGWFFGGPGRDRVRHCLSSDAHAISVERGNLPCPPPKSASGSAPLAVREEG